MKSVPSRSLKHGKEIWSPLCSIPFSLCILYSIQDRALCNLFTRDTFGLGAYIIDALLLLGHLALNLCQLQLTSECVCPATRDHFSSLRTERVIENGFICLLLSSFLQ